jgi:endonuclease/exonuclease/phosphatase family metal-dependent hydrolase
MRREAWLEALLFAAAAAAAFFGYGSPRAGAPSFEPGERPGGALRVATWNVGGAAHGAPHGLEEGDLAHVAQTLRTLGADVVVLHEVGSRGQLERLLDLYGEPCEARGPQGGVAVLVRGLEVQAAERVAGAAQALALDLERGGRRIALVALHANAYDARRRNGEVGAATDALLARPADARILLGDLNLDVDLDKQRDLFSNEEHADVEAYNYVEARLDDAALGRGATAEPDRRLDYVFVSPGVQLLGAGPWKGQRTGTMDHDPVVADLAL